MPGGWTRPTRVWRRQSNLYPWVADGIDSIESASLQEILNVAASSRDIVASLLGLGWVEDGVGEMESKAINQLAFLSMQDASEASRIVRMPFLQTLEASDVSALESLAQLAWSSERDFQRVMSHPTLRGGIWDDWAKIVATLNGVSKTNPQLVDALLDPNRVTLNNRVINLPRAGELNWP